MTNPDRSRICPLCAETIPVAAKVCPRCRQWLSLRSLRHPFIQGALTIVPLLILSGVLLGVGLTRFERLFNPRPFYSEMPNSLQILDSGMNWVETTNGARLYVTGILTNRSGISWKDVEFECRFFDTNGLMADAAHARGYLTIPSNDDSAFRVTVRPSRPEADYHAMKISVTTARNAQGPF